MALSSLARSASKGPAVPWNPFRVTGTPMPPNLLLMCKILAVAILATGHWRILPEPFLPFLDGLDRLAEPAVFRTTLQTVCVLAAILLLCNRGVRASALVLGACLLVGVVSSKAYYGNNKTFVGLALVLAGLSDFDRPPYLLRGQLALVYFGAALNKLLDEDWRSGLFFDYWASAKLKNPVYLTVAGWLPPLVAGKILCWGTIVAEFFAALGLLVPRLVPYALGVNVLFQVGLLEFTGTTFTLFFYGMSAATLAFVTWPERITVHHDEPRRSHRAWYWVMKVFDPDRVQDWKPSSPTLAVDRRGHRYGGLVVVPWLLLTSPVFWLLATAALALLPGNAETARRVFVAVVLVFFLPCLRTLRLRV